MLGLGEPSVKRLTKKISNQMIGFQSVMYRLSHEQLGISQQDIVKLEITFFAMSLVTLSTSYLSKYKNKMAAIESAQFDVLRASLQHSESEISLEKAVSSYRERFQQYKGFFDILVDQKQLDPEIDIALLFVKNVSRGKAERPSFIVAQQIFAQVITDNLNFVKNVL
ncbi:hypothetical protein [Pseudovibrio sp. POLY-S9]|uniref:hypothetical protein n=1 Tax=Pseudovibrio sp. POLY-S9 TaxID=1576596 RepID=UPI000A6EE899|nr:hypothetical protein [Pseudovibrio sp. POLY-S9]